MKFIAQFDLTSDVSMPNDAQKYSIQSPNGDYSLVFREISSKEDERLAKFRCNMEFESENLENSRQDFLDRLLGVLDIMSLITHAEFRLDRLHKIFDWTPNKTMRSGLIFIYDPPESTPDWILDQEFFEATNLFQHATMDDQVLRPGGRDHGRRQRARPRHRHRLRAVRRHRGAGVPLHKMVDPLAQLVWKVLVSETIANLPQVADINEEGAAETREAIDAQGGVAVAMPLDVTKRSQCVEVADAVRRLGGRRRHQRGGRSGASTAASTSWSIARAPPIAARPRISPRSASTTSSSST